MPLLRTVHRRARGTSRLSAWCQRQRPGDPWGALSSQSLARGPTDSETGEPDRPGEDTNNSNVWVQKHDRTERVFAGRSERTSCWFFGCTPPCAVPTAASCHRWGQPRATAACMDEVAA